MEVACPECGTRFSLEASRIPGATARVRCSRCRHVFRINREGQVVVPPEEPPEPSLEETPPIQEVAEKISVTLTTETVGPPSAPENVEVPQEATVTSAEIPVSPEKGRFWLWLPALFLVAVILAGLGWWTWQGTLATPLKPLAEAVQRLKKNWRQPAPVAPDSKAGTSAPAPLVITPPSPPVPAPDLRDLPVDWAQARYKGLVNNKGGQLLVIRGEVANKGKILRGPIRLKATLTDSQHRPLREEVVYVGTTLTDEELKTLDPNTIKSWLAQPGGRSQDQELEPGKKQPFTVVFFGVPANLAEVQAGFQLVIVEGPVIGGESARK